MKTKTKHPLEAIICSLLFIFWMKLKKKKKKKNKNKNYRWLFSSSIWAGKHCHSLTLILTQSHFPLSLSLSLSLWNLNLQWIESNWEKNVEVRVPYDVSRRNSSDIERIPNRQHFRERSLQTELRFRFRSLHSTPLPHRLSPRVLFLFIFHSLSILSFLSSIFKIQTKPEKP